MVFWKDSTDFDNIIAAEKAQPAGAQLGGPNINRQANMNNSVIPASTLQAFEKNPFVREANVAINLLRQLQGNRAIP